LYRLYVEVLRTPNNFERFKIKVIKKFNVPSKSFKAIYGKRRKNLKAFVVGRGLNEEDILQYISEYIKREGLWQKIITMRLETL